MQQNRAIAAGAFVLFGILLFAVGLFYIGDRRMLFTDTIRVHAEFSSIAALDNGATVRVAGMDAGEVELIQVPSGPTGKFRVRMRIREDLHPLVRLDSVASIQNDGLVGNKFVQIDSGTEMSPQVRDQGTIQSREPFDLATLMDKLSGTIDMVTTMLVDVKTQLDTALIAVADTARDAQTLIDDVGTDVRSIMGSTGKVTADLTAIVSGLRAGRGTVGKLLTDDSLHNHARAIAAEAQKAMENVRQATDQARGAIADLRGDGGQVKGLTTDLQQTLALARDAMADLAENSEALKRSFFFRGFFNRRGYFDLDDVSVADYRKGALDTADRRVLRIWLSAEVLFETDENGVERLTPGGRARLDSAMSQFVRYPKTSPFVIEGYATGVTNDVRHLVSRSRAELVRDYLIGKFVLDANYVATMAMGNEAEDSPAGDEWAGIALAMFVPATAS
jgi:phospholipid/cholesterol/gamma-HCH transport system substrate-binding protein